MLCFIRAALVTVFLHSNRKVTETVGQCRMKSPETKYTQATKRIRRLYLYMCACTFINAHMHLTTVIRRGYQLEAGYGRHRRGGTWEDMEGGKERGKVI